LSTKSDAQAPIALNYPNFCSGSTIDISTVIAPAGTKTYTWTIGTPSNLSGGVASATPKAAISQTLIIGSSPGSAATQVFTVTDNSGIKYAITVAVVPPPPLVTRLVGPRQDAAITYLLLQQHHHTLQFPIGLGQDLLYWVHLRYWAHLT